MSTRAEKIREEIVKYLITFVYLAVFLGVFAWYRRLILMEENVPVTDYFMPLIEAAVLGKVILILDMFSIARRFEGRPLIVPIIYKTLLFSAAIALVSALEHIVRGLVHHHTVAWGLEDLLGVGKYELISRCLVKLFALIPFFAFHEINRALGPGRLTALFLKGAEVRPTHN